MSRASLTTRFSGIDPDTLTRESLKEKSQEFCNANPKRKQIFLWWRHETQAHPPLVSIAQHGDFDTGTVTFPSQEAKMRALKTSRLEGWRVDDTFAGLTVLHSAPEPDLDICAIHGLNGNAFDTFAWDGRQMWLRDFLPKLQRHHHPDLQRLRVMTFGYNSLVRDNKSITRLDDWCLELLQSVSAMRKSPSERSRPIIFVCHSLGGIVARQVMIRLEKFPSEGLKLEHCGLLFLSTPHLGTDQANWSDLLLLVAKGGGVGRGQTFAQLLGEFSQASVSAQEQFAALQPVPPVDCLYETQRTPVAGTSRLIVSAASAGLLQRAKPMQNVDHRTICRFPDMHHPGYLQVLDCLDDIRRRLVEKTEGQPQEQQLEKPQQVQQQQVQYQDQQQQDQQQDQQQVQYQDHQQQDQQQDQQQEQEHDGPLGGLRGGDSVGGNATSNVPGGTAEGGSAIGGNVEFPALFYNGMVPLAGGDAKGGDAFVECADGGIAVGGSAVGGSVRWVPG